MFTAFSVAGDYLCQSLKYILSPQSIDIGIYCHWQQYMLNETICAECTGINQCVYTGINKCVYKRTRDSSVYLDGCLCFLSMKQFFQVTWTSQELHKGIIVIRPHVNDQNVSQLTCLLSLQLTLSFGR